MQATSTLRSALLPVLAATLALASVSCSSRGKENTVSAGSTPSTMEVRDADGPAVMSAVREPGASAVVVNVWATWCEPCREEFPDLVQLYRTYQGRGVRLVLVSGDFDSESTAVRRFLTERGVDFRTYMKTGDEMKFINDLDPRWSGALPATWIFDGKGTRRDFWEGKATYARMEERLLRVLQNPNSTDSTEARS